MSVKTRDAVFMAAGSVILAGLFLSKYDKRWLVLNGIIGAGLLNAGVNGYCTTAYLLEKSGISEPDTLYSEKERLERLKKRFSH